MNKHTTKPRIIIDKSFIQGMPKDGKPFRAMRKQGGRIVLIDTLFYELCSTCDAEIQYPASMRKLTVCPDAIECWTHVSKMLKVELKKNRPYGDPLRCEITKNMQQQLANNSQWPLVDIEEERRKRENNSILKLFQEFVRYQTFSEEITREINNKSFRDKEVIQFYYNFINNPDNIRSSLKAILQYLDDVGETWVILNPNDVDKTWTIWHLTKSLLAMLCDCQRRDEYAFDKIAEKGLKRLNNLKHDLDYLVSLAFADAIASRETTGEMSYYRRWMFGDGSKPLISSYKKDKIDSVMNKFK